MDLVNSIVDTAMNMKQVQFQQDLQTTLLKKTLDTNTELAKNLLDSMAVSDNVPKFPGAKGSILDVRA